MYLDLSTLRRVLNPALLVQNSGDPPPSRINSEHDGVVVASQLVADSGCATGLNLGYRGLICLCPYMQCL